MTHSSSDQNSNFDLSDNALAHLVLGASGTVATQSPGAPASVQELRDLSAGTLSATRRQQVLQQLTSKPDLYRIWMAMPAAPEVVTSRPTQKAVEVVSWRDRVRALCSWPSLIPLACGLVLGAVIKFDSGAGLERDQEPEVVVVQEPVSAPQKASMTERRVADLNHLHRCVAMPDASGVETSLCISDSRDVQSWYWLSGADQIKVVTPPLKATRLRDMKADAGLLVLLLEQGGSLQIQTLALHHEATGADLRLELDQLYRIDAAVDEEVRLLAIRDHSVYYRIGMQTRQLALTK